MNKKQRMEWLASEEEKEIRASAEKRAALSSTNDRPIGPKNLSAPSGNLSKKYDTKKVTITDLPLESQKEILTKARASTTPVSEKEIQTKYNDLIQGSGYDPADPSDAKEIKKLISEFKREKEYPEFQKNIDAEISLFLDKQDPSSGVVKSLLENRSMTVLEKSEEPISPLLSDPKEAVLEQDLSMVNEKDSEKKLIDAKETKEETKVEKKESVGSKFLKGAEFLKNTKAGGVLATGMRDRAEKIIGGLSRNQKIAVAAGGMALGAGIDFYKKRKAAKEREAAEASSSASSVTSSESVSPSANSAAASQNATAGQTPAASRVETTQTSVKDKPLVTAPVETKKSEDPSTMKTMDDITSGGTQSKSPNQLDKEISTGGTSLPSQTSSTTSNQKDLDLPSKEVFLEMNRSLASIKSSLSSPLSIRNTEPFRPSSQKF
jgi:hypothetical protein